MPNAESRGWGPGWPNCPGTKIVTLVRSDGVKLPVRREIVELVALLCDESERLAYDLVPGWCWGFACRPIRGRRTPSNHSWGLAIDINAPKNPMGSILITDIPSQVVALWKRYGWYWGGDYSGRKDAMHFEFLGTPEDAARFTELARRQIGKDEDVKEDERRWLHSAMKNAEAAKIAANKALQNSEAAKAAADRTEALVREIATQIKPGG